MMKRVPTYRRTLFFMAVFMAMTAGFCLRAVYLLDIETHKASYFDRQGREWSAKSRIIGLVTNPVVNFTYEIVDPVTSKVLQAHKCLAGIHIYESDWLPKGTYNLTFKAEGYRDALYRGAVLKPKTDCRIDVKFCLD